MSSMRGKFLNILLEMTLFMLFSDILFRYSGSFSNSILIKIGNTFLNIGGPFLLILLYRYIDGWLTLDAARTRVWSSLILTIVLINITLVFTLDAANILYYSEIMIIIKAIFYGLFILYLIKYRSEIKKSYKNTLISSMFFPFIFTLIQLEVNNIQTEYIGLTLAYLILIINIQRKDMSEDALTGATNRRMLNIELEDRIELAKTGRPFSAFMIDIDYFNF
ncbi:diguanylate cyclase [Lachnospira multipara]|uniref:diguanylate cyclase n=1 Tax=Lachnospira multipara TaxID=28051 RepID=UPI0018CC740C|nr:diguanylate cyclase [Lachnospira multipara]